MISSKNGYDRNSNQTWRQDVAAAAGSVPTEDQMFWYDGLTQVYQRQRGTLTLGSRPYTGITSFQKNHHAKGTLLPVPGTIHLGATVVCGGT